MSHTDLAPVVVIPEPMTRFECNLKGCCCHGWTIPFRTEDMARLGTALPRAEVATRIEPVARIVPDADPSGERKFTLTTGPENACTFLEEAGSCEVHRRFGPSVLPRICINFPAVPYRAGDRVEMYFSTVCPSVLDRIAEGPGAYELATLADGGTGHVRLRADRVTGARTVVLGEVEVSMEVLRSIRERILAALNDDSRPLLEVVADVSYSLAGLKALGDFNDFDVPEVVERQSFYDFFSQSIWSHAAELLTHNLRSYERFVFDVDMADLMARPSLTAALADWEPHYRHWVLPTIPEWLLRRWAAHRYFTVFTGGEEELRLSYGSVVHTMALACRLMAGICGALGRPIDVPITKLALGSAEYFHRKLATSLPPEAMPWFVG